MDSDGQFDYDWIVIGSGFGGSVSALRLAEKGHRVAVLECGARFEDHDFAEQTSDAKRYYWMPYLGLKGISETDAVQGHLRSARDAVSAVAASDTQTRSTARCRVSTPTRNGRSWPIGSANSRRTTTPPSGCSASPTTTPRDPADLLLKEYGRVDRRRRHLPANSRRRLPRRAGQDGARPLLRRRGARSGRGASSADRAWSAAATAPRTPCARTISGSRSDAGVEIRPERTVIDVVPLDGNDGREGYSVTSVRSGAWARREKQTLRARGVVVAAGALGTNRLLQRCKLNGSLPEDLRPARLSRAHQQRVEHGGDRADRLPRRLHTGRSRSPRASTPTPTPTSRSSPGVAAATRSRCCSR